MERAQGSGRSARAMWLKWWERRYYTGAARAEGGGSCCCRSGQGAC